MLGDHPVCSSMLTGRQCMSFEGIEKRSFNKHLSRRFLHGVPGVLYMGGGNRLPSGDPSVRLLLTFHILTSNV